ncbi:response regulator [Roseomonas frigidaquae]|uniref:Response regulator n=1 Tax=Falsiroseomonas frigidaquae TaxID=487318 RepID=A0ABX1F626_9PROT|nr:response regulator [Falsiroseomonas frigidaquae]NKE47838.1 response regulator [Falsiroseomonas frigidaquae]
MMPSDGRSAEGREALNRPVGNNPSDGRSAEGREALNRPVDHNPSDGRSAEGREALNRPVDHNPADGRSAAGREALNRPASQGTLDRDLLDAFVPEFEAEAVRLAMVRDAAAAGRALDQLRAMAAALGAPSLATLVDRTAQRLDPLDWPALHAGAEALARQAVAIGAAGTDLPLAQPAAAQPEPELAAPPAALVDREMLEAFAPEFATACDRLAKASDAAAAGRALDGLRAMAGAVELTSLLRLLEPAAGLLDPFDAAALHALAARLREQAARIVAAGADVAPPEPEPVPDVAAPVAAALDAELLAAFTPEFAAACTRLATAPDAAMAARATEALRGMAASFGLASLGAMLADAPPDDPAALPGLAAALVGHAAAIAAAGHDLPPPDSLPAGRRRVLVVDDSAMMRRLVREALALDADFEVVGEAADGIQALAAMQRLAPDLTMLDIEMPELDGLGVLRRWALEGGGAVVIVSSAARPGSATAVTARRLGAAGIVGKPSGALSPDLRERQGVALLRTARRAAGLPVEAGR